MSECLVFVMSISGTPITHLIRKIGEKDDQGRT